MLKSNTDQLGQESPETVEGKRLIVEWISKQPHLPQDVDDVLLESFLSTCKYNIEKCKKRIDKWYTLKTLYPQYFGSGDPTSQEIRDISNVCKPEKVALICQSTYEKLTLLNKNIHCFNFISKLTANISELCFSGYLPKYTPAGYAVSIHGLLDNDTAKFDINSSIQHHTLVSHSHLFKEKNTNIVCIYDARQYTLSHVPLVMPHLNAIAQFGQDILPVRMKQLHFIISSAFINKVINAFMPLLKEKIRNRVHVHSDNLDSLYKFVPQDILPVEYGGKEESVKTLNEIWQNKIESLKDWLITEVPKSTDETKRPAELRRNELFGVEGTFKSLNVD